MSKPKTSNKPDAKDSSWPKLLCLSPKKLILLICLWILLAWAAFIVTDILGWIDTGFRRPVWSLLFNDRPIEWTQWFLLAFAIASSAYLAGRLDSKHQTRIARFFFLLAIGLGLMFIEDAGDIRHVLNREVARVFGHQIFGLRHSFVVEAPYFLAIASVPLYALVRYGRDIWKYTRTRTYLILGFALYGLAAAGSALSNLAHTYVIVGSLIDNLFFAGRLPLLPGRSQGFTYFMFTDSVIEESIELLAITFLLAAILAFAHEVRNNRLIKP